MRLGQVSVWLATKCLIFFLPFIFSDLVAFQADATVDASQSLRTFATHHRSKSRNFPLVRHFFTAQNLVTKGKLAVSLKGIQCSVEQIDILINYH